MLHVPQYRLVAFFPISPLVNLKFPGDEGESLTPTMPGAESAYISKEFHSRLLEYTCKVGRLLVQGDSVGLE